MFEYLAHSQYGQQASVFSKDPQAVSKLIDVLVNQVSRVNLNSQCQRGPDSFPFTYACYFTSLIAHLLTHSCTIRARKDSAYGTLSLSDALRVFTIRSLVAAKQEKQNEELVNSIISSRSSNFLRLDYMF